MARRSRKGVVDDLFAIALKLPWWASVAIAVVSYLVLHAYATTDVPLATSPADIGRVAGHGLLRTVAAIGQVVLPLIFVIGAVAAFLRQRKTAKLADDVAARNSAEVLEEMSWREFEQLVGEAFRRQGYRVTQVGGDGPDGGVDLILTRESEKTLVQCKQWRAQRVGVSVVRELYGVMAARRAAAGIVVTSGQFTPDAIDFASGRNVRLIGGAELHKLVASAEPHSPVNTGSGALRTRSAVIPPACPQCGNEMVKRESTRGAIVGKSFWGCGRFPACRGTKAID